MGCHLGTDGGNGLDAVTNSINLLWEVLQELFDVLMTLLKGLSLCDCIQSYSWS